MYLCRGTLRVALLSTPLGRCRLRSTAPFCRMPRFRRQVLDQAERSRVQAAKHRVALRCTLRSTARRRLQNQGQRAPGPRSACPRLTLRSLSSRSNGGGLCRCSSRSSHELAIGSFPRRIYNGSRKFLFQPLMNLLHALIWRENQRAMHLRSDFGRSTT